MPDLPQGIPIKERLEETYLVCSREAPALQMSPLPQVIRDKGQYGEAYPDHP